MIKSLVRTNDVNEMIQIGKELVEEHPDVFTKDEIRARLIKITNNLGIHDKNERQNVLYQSIYDYCVYGTSQVEEIFYEFLNKTDAEKREYITSRDRYDYYYKMNDINASYILNNKYETYLKFKEYFKRDVIQLKDESDYDVFCGFVKKHPEFIVKPSSLALTIGVYKENVANHGSLRELFDNILKQGARSKEHHTWEDSWSSDKDLSVVLEELIDQDDSLSTIHPGSVNGLRLTTIYGKDGSIVNFYPWFKIGNHGKFITAETFGSLMAGVNTETGIVDTDGADEAGKHYEYHPYTGVKIKGYVIPRWDECVAMVTELAQSLHDDGIDHCGWDMALTKDGWCVMEGNYDAEFLGQLVYKKGIKKELEDIIGWKPNKEFWWE